MKLGRSRCHIGAKTVMRTTSANGDSLVALANSHGIGQFRIPGGTGAKGVKPTKARLMRGRIESTRAVAMANHNCFAFNCTNKKQKNI